MECLKEKCSNYLDRLWCAEYCRREYLSSPRSGEGLESGVVVASRLVRDDEQQS